MGPDALAAANLIGKLKGDNVASTVIMDIVRNYHKFDCGGEPLSTNAADRAMPPKGLGAGRQVWKLQEKTCFLQPRYRKPRTFDEVNCLAFPHHHWRSGVTGPGWGREQTSREQYCGWLRNPFAPRNVAMVETIRFVGYLRWGVISFLGFCTVVPQRISQPSTGFRT